MAAASVVLRRARSSGARTRVPTSIGLPTSPPPSTTSAWPSGRSRNSPSRPGRHRGTSRGELPAARRRGGRRPRAPRRPPARGSRARRARQPERHGRQRRGDGDQLPRRRLRHLRGEPGRREPPRDGAHEVERSGGHRRAPPLGRRPLCQQGVEEAQRERGRFPERHRHQVGDDAPDWDRRREPRENRRAWYRGRHRGADRSQPLHHEPRDPREVRGVRLEAVADGRAKTRSPAVAPAESAKDRLKATSGSASAMAPTERPKARVASPRRPRARAASAAVAIQAARSVDPPAPANSA